LDVFVSAEPPPFSGGAVDLSELQSDFENDVPLPGPPTNRLLGI